MELSARDLLAVDSLRDARISPDGARVAFCRVSSDVENDRRRSEITVVELGPEETLRPLWMGPGTSPRWAPDSSRLAYLADVDEDERDLSVVDPATEESRPVARLRSPGPPAWDPSGTTIAITCATTEGEPSRIVLLDIAAGSVRALVAEPDVADACPAWSSDGRLAFARLRPGEGGLAPTSEIRIADLDRVESKELATGLSFATAPSWRPDGETLACVGTRPRRLGAEDPALRAWIVAATGGEAEEASAAAIGVVLAPVPEGPSWSADGRKLYLRLAQRGEIRIIALEPAGGAEPLTEGGQVVDFSLAGDGSLVWTELSARDPGGVQLRRPGGQPSKRIATGRWIEGRGREVAASEYRTFRCPDGEDLDGWLLGVDRSRSPQPLLLSLHGGPHGFFGPVFQAGHFYRHILAERGWVVLCLNATGSGSYGEAFADRIRGGWGERDLPEHQAAIAALVEEGVVDEGRMAVAGYSYGGYLAAWTTAHDERFHAAVIGAPITDLRAFERSSDIGAWWTPWEMDGSPSADDARYERLSPLTHAGAISAPVLLLHGDADRRVPIEQSESLRERLEAAGRARVEMVRYPGGDHLFYANGSPARRVDFNRRIVDFLEREIGERNESHG